MFLQNMNTDMLSPQGTAIDEAIRLSSTYFDQDQSTERLLFIVSDGEDHNDLSYEMADLAAKITLPFTLLVSEQKRAHLFQLKKMEL